MSPMNQEQLALYQAIGNYATEQLFWSLVLINNAAFNTPLRHDAKNKLMSMGKVYDTIISSIYPNGEGKELVAAMMNNNRLFIAYIEHLMQGSGQAHQYKLQWKDSGRQIAQILCKMNPYWRAMEWTAMIGHEADLLDTIATNMQAKNYATFVNMAPICQHLAIDMSQYMCSGICKQKPELTQGPD